MILQPPHVIAQTQLMNGQSRQAFKTAKAAMARHPKNALLPNVAALALCAQGKPREAVPLFQKAIQIDPGFIDAQRNLAQTLVLLNMADKALVLLQRLIRQQPEDEGAQYLCAQALSQLGRTEEAEAAVGRAIALAPRLARNYNLRGLLRNRLGLTDAALADFEAALTLDPNNVETLVNISLPLARLTRHDEALSTAQRAVMLAPDHIGAHLRLAETWVEAGQSAEARAEYHAVLGLEPQNAEAIEQLATLQDREENGALLTIARAALKHAPAHSPDRAGLNFALARIAQQAGDSDGEARHLADANREMARALPYDAGADSALTDRIIGYFPLPPDPAVAEAVTPIYVLGLPRSGTTLAEAILAAHPAVKGLGEQIAAGRALMPLIEAGEPIGPEALEQLRQTEKRLHPPLPEGCRAFVDKMPENYRLLGFLLAAHPEARIIHLTRDPRDVALSMWRGRFAGSALSYTYDLKAMAHRFNLYARLMAFWHAEFPGRILDLSYEEMTGDVEAASRRLAEFCGLDWVPAMARPNETQAAVLTMSATQLRQPVHRQSVGKWRAQAEALAPFIAGLDPTLWPALAE